MTVETTNITSGPYTGNGLSDEYDYDFRVDNKNQLIVYETDDDGVQTTLTVDTDYTVGGVGVDEGGTITRVAGNLPTGYKWYIRSNYQATQETDFASQGGFFPRIHARAFDKLTFLAQQLTDRISRSLRFSDSYSGNADPSLDAPVAGAYIRWNNDGSKLINDSDISTIITTSGAVATVAGIADEIVAVDGIAADVTAVAGIAAEVEAVADIAAGVTAVAGIAANVTTVAGIDTEVAAVAGIAADVTAVAGIAADVTAVAAIDSDVTTAAANIAAIVAAATHATTATTQAGIATTKAAEAAASAALAEAIALGVASGRPTIRPSLILDFANSKVLDPRVTFTRASAATYFDANGVMQTAAANECRLHHNPVTGECLGIYGEGAATNLLTYSEDFSNAAWAKAGNGTGSAAAVTPNDAIAPDGELTADLIVLDRGAGNTLSDYSTISQNSFSLTNGVTYSGGLFIKAATVGDVGKEIAIRYAEGAYDVHTLTTTWQRVSGAETATSSYAGGFEIANRGGVTADNTVSFHAWGAQLETGSRASSYIKTEASTVTRAADSASMTGTNFSSWYNASEGTFVMEVSEDYSYTAGARGWMTAHDGALTNSINMYHAGGSLALDFYNGGAQQVAFSPTYATKAAIAYKTNDSAGAAGGSVSTDSVCVVPSGINQIIIGSTYAGNTFPLNGTIKRLTYYPRRLTNAELQIITA